MKRRFLYLAPVLMILTSLCIAFLPSNKASADVITGPRENVLVYIASHCQGVKATSSHMSKDKKECTDREGNFHEFLKCSDKMFYKHDFHGSPDKSVVTASKWYINQGAYKDCYNKLVAQYNLVASDTCANLVKGSSNWEKCDAAQTKLGGYAGCTPGGIFEKDRTQNLWKPNAGHLNDCKNRMDAIGSQTLIYFTSGDTTARTDPIASASVIAQPPSSGGGGGTSSNATSTPACESGGDPLAWILCKVYDAVGGVTDWLFNDIVVPLLKVNPVCTQSKDAGSCGQKNNVTYDVWSGFRIYANVFLVIALLAVVFGQSIGGGLMDAYTAKKMLPRLLIAAVLINLSIYIVAFLVDIANIVGGSIGQLIISPLQDAAAFKISPGGIQAGAILGGGLVAGVIGGGTVVAAAFTGGAGFSMLLFALVLPAGLAVLAVFITLVIRQAIIMALVLVAPVAFALWCLPNTEQYFKRWWRLLFQMLVVYPAIVLIFAVADVLSAIMGGVDSHNPLNQVVSFMLLIIPLFLIPLALRQSNAILGQIQNAASTAGKKLNSLADNKRAEVKSNFDDKRKERKASMYNGLASSPFGKRLGRVPVVGRQVGMRAQRAEQRVSMKAAETARDPRLAPVANDGDALKAGMTSSYDEAVRTMGKEAADRWDATGLGYGTAANIAAFQAAVADGTVFKDNKEQAAAIVGIAGKNESLRTRIWGAAYAGNKAAGRFDLSPSFIEGKKLVDDVANNGLESVSEERWENAAVEGLRTASNTDLSRMKGAGMNNGASAMTKALQRQRARINDASATLRNPNASESERVEAQAHMIDAQRNMAEVVAKAENMRDSGIYMPEALTKTLHQRTLNPAQEEIEYVQQISHASQADTIEARQAAQRARENPGDAGLAEAAQQAAERAARTADSAARAAEQVRPYQEQRQSGRIDPRAPGGPMAVGEGGAAPEPPSQEPQ